MEISIKELGLLKKMENKLYMAEEFISMLMAPNTSAGFMKVISLDREDSFFTMEISMKGILKIENIQVKVSMSLEKLIQ
eukprot:CAMPEP_0205802548 /NCGR_PEP_ID=MMETSP0205-20121125/4909_1 /ASSEMBLY_ACC=CAM_ASM_000278 /TAXON_ID=36767 /ORGANISM="Euplotes focardii, Strain TN1" /LENGTH=78 /DNA_ID=CAMNT_0053069151 /DNA_START=302 /DNA_END=538 /DNA_ORIENTATION=+